MMDHSMKTRHLTNWISLKMDVICPKILLQKVAVRMLPKEVKAKEQEESSVNRGQPKKVRRMIRMIKKARYLKQEGK